MFCLPVFLCTTLYVPGAHGGKKGHQILQNWVVDGCDLTWRAWSWSLASALCRLSSPCPDSLRPTDVPRSRGLCRAQVHKHIVGEQVSCFAHVADPAQESARTGGCPGSGVLLALKAQGVHLLSTTL